MKCLDGLFPGANAYRFSSTISADGFKTRPEAHLVDTRPENTCTNSRQQRYVLSEACFKNRVSELNFRFFDLAEG